ncbi:aminoacyl-tRNA hydrolase [Candidatus Saccharibacteria bacterium]|nr:aminoacyl-tRNA hydrolase [Candidatus Saccharibacteria bacterium]
MKLIVGLGNPGDQYNFTRHNFGFLALDFYAKVKGWQWAEHPKFGAIYHKEGDAIFIKPQAFYNDSGIPVRAFVDFYKIDLSDILVICDDFNLDFGEMRYRAKGSDGGNNGLKSITKHLSSMEYPRLRLGTGNDEMRRQLGDVDFVLSKFTPAEKERLPEILRAVVEKVDSL